MKQHPTLLLALGLSVFTTARPEPPPIAAFGRPPAIENPTLSPDGRYLLFIAAAKAGALAPTVVDLRDAEKRTELVRWPLGRPVEITCRFANSTRVICALQVIAREEYSYPLSWVISVNADGTDSKLLSSEPFPIELKDIIDFTPLQPESVLASVGGFPRVLEWNIYTGALREREGMDRPIRSFSTDGWGNVRLASGSRATTGFHFGRLKDQKGWRTLATFELLDHHDAFEPVQIIADTNRYYAVGPRDGRKALWELDIENKAPPRLIFSHPQYDVLHAILANDRRLLGVAYETDRPAAQYFDERTKGVMSEIDGRLADSYNEILEATADERIYLIRSRSDVDAGTYYLYDVMADGDKLRRLGTSYPELDRQQLPRLRTIEYPARDGTGISGYLTVPFGVAAKNLPLVVMPHDGPHARDRWEFDFMRLFLASRGYAVLQMNFRGSDGLGRPWLHAGYGSYAGVMHTDITDGARWAVAERIADPRRVCILGRGYGGYAALLGATRNGDLYRCAVSIGGYSDLKALLKEREGSDEGYVMKQDMGTDPEKLKRDSPITHAAQAAMPILLVHGSRDWHVDNRQSVRMAKALKRAHKPHQLLVIEEGTWNLVRVTDRTTLLSAVEKFLATHLRSADSAVEGKSP